jgi:hypothetical protein
MLSYRPPHPHLSLGRQASHLQAELHLLRVAPLRDARQPLHTRRRLRRPAEPSQRLPAGGGGGVVEGAPEGVGLGLEPPLLALRPRQLRPHPRQLLPLPCQLVLGPAVPCLAPLHLHTHSHIHTFPRRRESAPRAIPWSRTSIMLAQSRD